MAAGAEYKIWPLSLSLRWRMINIAYTGIDTIVLYSYESVYLIFNHMCSSVRHTFYTYMYVN